MKRLLLGIGGLLAAALVWYLFIYPYDYRVTFKVKTFPGAVNQTIKGWAITLDSSEIVSQQDLNHLDQRLQFQDSVLLYHWEIDAITDSTSRVRVYAKDQEHSLMNKLRIPFSDTDFEKRTRKTLIDFNLVLSEHIKNFKVTITGEAQLPSTYCACVTQSGPQFEKAHGMMRDYPLLGSILVDNNVQLNGPPFIEIKDWDMQTDSIHYEFCYPIIRSENLPQHPDLKYRRLFSKKAIKAVYNGNYITSDRAWYALLTYAQHKGLDVTGLPIEVFYSNPNLGGDAMQWEADIYMPLKESNE
jgi:effector-binding domain-containing protein